MGSFWFGSFLFCCLEEKKDLRREENECVRKELICYVGRSVFMEVMVCKKKNMEESYVW
jgi:hypothetical protein